MIGTTRSGIAMHDGNLRDAGRRHAGLIGKTAAAGGKGFIGVHQVGTAALGQGHHWQAVFQRNLLNAQRLVHPGR